MRYTALLGLLTLAVSSAFVPAQLRQNIHGCWLTDQWAKSDAAARHCRTRLFYTNDSPDFYQILGVSRNATPKEIKSAYRQKARLFHPDANPGTNTVEQFQDINRAHEVLNDPYLKQKYDMYGDNENGVGTSAYSDHSTVYDTTVPTDFYTPRDFYAPRDYRRQSARRESSSSPFGRPPPRGSASAYKHDATSAGPFGGSTTGFGQDTTRRQVRNPFGTESGTSFGHDPSSDPFFKKGFEQTVTPPPPTNEVSETVEEFFSTTMGGGFRDPGPVVDVDDLRMDLDGFMNDGKSSSQRRRSRHGQVGDDLRFDLEIDLKTACYGGEEKILIQHLEACDTCGGRGVHTGTCSACNGRGASFHMTQNLHGVRQNEKVCRQCHGTGQQVEADCGRCGSQGLQHKIKELTVKIPAGVEDFTKLRVRGEGNAGPNGGPAGDLFIFVKVRDHPTSRRVGPELYSEQSIDLLDAIFGASIQCPFVDDNLTIDVEPGTQPGKVVRLKGSGAPKLGQPDVRGDHHVTVNVEIPTKLSKEEEAIFIKLKNLRDSKSKTKDTVFGGVI